MRRGYSRTVLTIFFLLLLTTPISCKKTPDESTDNTSDQDQTSTSSYAETLIEGLGTELSSKSGESGISESQVIQLTTFALSEVKEKELFASTNVGELAPSLMKATLVMLSTIFGSTETDSKEMPSPSNTVLEYKVLSAAHAHLILQFKDVLTGDDLSNAAVALMKVTTSYVDNAGFTNLDAIPAIESLAMQTITSLKEIGTADEDIIKILEPLIKTIVGNLGKNNSDGNGAGLSSQSIGPGAKRIIIALLDRKSVV